MIGQFEEMRTFHAYLVFGGKTTHRSLQPQGFCHGTTSRNKVANAFPMFDAWRRS
jgi:hypothetical protein